MTFKKTNILLFGIAVVFVMFLGNLSCRAGSIIKNPFSISIPDNPLKPYYSSVNEFIIKSYLISYESIDGIRDSELQRIDNESSYSQAGTNKSIWDEARESFRSKTLKVKILLVILVYLLLSIAILFFSIIINRYLKTQKRKRVKQIKDEYQGILASFLFDEDEEQFEFYDIDKPLNRQIFIDEIRDLHSNLHGETADKLRDLYFNLNLHKDSLRKVYRRRWDIKAKGFRELAQMDVKDANDQIAKYVNAKNPILRVDAQVAMVKLSEGNRLSFLDDLKYDLSYWEQVNIFDTLVYHQINIDSFEPWLENENQSVVLFAIRMIGLFKHVQSASKIRDLLYNENPEIRLAAVQTLGKLEMPIFISDLKELYKSESEQLRIIIDEAKARDEFKNETVKSLDDLLPRKTRLEIIEAMRPVASMEDISFFEEIVQNPLNSFKLRLLTTEIIMSLGPEGEQRLYDIYHKSDDLLKSMIINVKQNQES